MSKYEDKHYHPYNPVDKLCPRCNKWFSIDPEDCEIFYDDFGEDYYCVWCPYCARRLMYKI